MGLAPAERGTHAGICKTSVAASAAPALKLLDAGPPFRYYMISYH